MAYFNPIRFMKKTICMGLMLALAAGAAEAQSAFTLEPTDLPNPDNEPAAVHPVPSDRQLKWQETEFYAFFHYGMNTYTNKEWGYGDENEAQFAPTAAPDPRQWLKVAKAAGMKGGIAVVKHHDGFCLWPTATTTHNISRAGNDYGRRTNIPRDFAKAARALNMKYGFYISPWDRNSPLYGTPDYVSQVFLRQCAELAEYGNDQFEMWFDGANGGDGYYGGRNTTVSVDNAVYYDVPNLRDSVHKVCPDCVLWGVGGEARWIGNENGWAGETNWSTENRGYAPEKNGMYGTEDGWYWLPGESDAKATRNGWFWHTGVGDGPKSLDALYTMYLETVGRNSTLILNLPPDRSGRLNDTLAARMKELGRCLRERLGRDLAPRATVSASHTRRAGKNRNYKASNLTDDNKNTYWATDDSTRTATLTLTWRKPQRLHYVQLMEYVRLGQRVSGFRIEVSPDGTTWQPAAPGVECTTIGYKRIIPLDGSTTVYGPGMLAKAVRITITDSKACPLLHSVSVF